MQRFTEIERCPTGKHIIRNTFSIRHSVCVACTHSHPPLRGSCRAKLKESTDRDENNVNFNECYDLCGDFIKYLNGIWVDGRVIRLHTICDVVCCTEHNILWKHYFDSRSFSSYDETNMHMHFHIQLVRMNIFGSHQHSPHSVHSAYIRCSVYLTPLFSIRYILIWIECEDLIHTEDLFTYWFVCRLPWEKSRVGSSKLGVMTMLKNGFWVFRKTRIKSNYTIPVEIFDSAQVSQLPKPCTWNGNLITWLQLMRPKPYTRFIGSSSINSINSDSPFHSSSWHSRHIPTDNFIITSMQNILIN